MHNLFGDCVLRHIVLISSRQAAKSPRELGAWRAPDAGVAHGPIGAYRVKSNAETDFPLTVTCSNVRPFTFSATGGFAAFSNVQFFNLILLIGAFLNPRSDHAALHFFTSRFSTA